MPKAKSIDRELSDLEAAVLGTIAREQPITAYGVRAQFSDSQTTRWSASTGSIYPVVRRLADAGFVDARPRGDDGRSASELSITRTGTRALREWVVSAEDDDLGVPFDPVRARAQFVALLPPRDRASILEDMASRQRMLLERVRDEARSEADLDGGGRLVGPVMQNVVEIVESRIRLLERLAAELES